MQFASANQVVFQQLVNLVVISDLLIILSLLAEQGNSFSGLARTVFTQDERGARARSILKLQQQQPITPTISHHYGCGRVPLYEKPFNRSIKNADDDDDLGNTMEDPGDFRILYGDDAEFSEWPWVVKVEICADKCVSCTGSLLNSRWILTAGHCLANRITSHNVTAKMGLYDLVVPDKSSISVEMDKIVVHPNYSNLHYDLTLLRTRHPISFNDNIQPVCLVQLGTEDKDAVEWARKRKCYTIGYGLKNDLVRVTRLQEFAIVAREANECNTDKHLGVKLRNGSMCIGPVQGKIGASCRGDSGGPNQCYDQATNRWYLFSTVSYGPTECDREAQDKWLTVAVDLSKFEAWIFSVISDL